MSEVVYIKATMVYTRSIKATATERNIMKCSDCRKAEATTTRDESRGDWGIAVLRVCQDCKDRA